jgi:S-DNA-T family DNA segregation ATPase FtsK/SpoIIIE
MTTNFTLEQQANIVALIQKLNGLDIRANISGVEQGPVVTAYMFSLDHSTPISRIMKKSEDFALSLGVDNVIIQRVKDKIAIFIPNKDRQTVDYKEILYWYLNDPETNKMLLPIPLGVDHQGQKSSLDITACPHLLITGSTNSGKSVFETSILSSLVYRFSSQELNIYLVDTKGLDLTLFKTLPHVKTVADNVDDFHNMMFQVMGEVRRRLGVLQGASCQNIHQYHNMYSGDITIMPYIIVMLDEFGDLMDLDASYRKADKEKYETTLTVKGWLKSTTQICRAAGVHIIACTQRASVKVIDGDIKTNLPCRISLRVPSRVDSQIILGASGAENLLGKGDMLVKYPESDSIQRYHGPFVKMSDINELIVNYQQMKNIINPRR